MANHAYLGNKIRHLRKEAGMTQVQLAGRLSISPSYLNLIERNQRALTVPLLLRLTEIFELDLRTFSEDDEGRLVADLQEAFSDPIFAAHRLRDTDLRDLLGASPATARARRRGFSRRCRSSWHSPLAMTTFRPPSRVVSASRSVPIISGMR